jgi:hypothetical protein
MMKLELIEEIKFIWGNGVVEEMAIAICLN